MSKAKPKTKIQKTEKTHPKKTINENIKRNCKAEGRKNYIYIYTWMNGK